MSSSDMSSNKDAKMSPTETIQKVETTGVAEFINIQEADPVLARKMHVVNEAINQIGWTNYHWKMFCLNGFGYAVDSMLAITMSIAAGQVGLEFQPSYARGGQIALYVGLLFGALFWGLLADIIGRKWAFNLSLIVAALSGVIAGASPNYIFWCSFVALSGFGAGGNLVLDTTVFLEFLPHNKQWMVTLLALWWGIGQTVAGLLAWAFLPNYSCSAAETCTRANNMGWRYVYFTVGAMIFVMSIARILVVRFQETPKFLLCKGRDEDVVAALTKIASRYNRNCDLTVEQLQRHGTILKIEPSTFQWVSEIGTHYRGLFSNRKLGLSTALLWLSWALIGLAFPLFYVFLPEYLISRGAEFGQTSAYVTWRNYVLTQFCSIFGPILAAAMCHTRLLGRKYTMVIGALVTMAFLFASTAVRTNAQSVGLNCAVSFALNIYYGTLYAYSPEVLPSAHRATGNGTAVAFNRIMGIMAAVVATVASTSTPVPIYVCGASFIGMAIVAALMPFEPGNTQSA